MATTRPTWDDFKAHLDAAIQEIVDAQNATDGRTGQAERAAQTRLRDLSDTPPGQRAGRWRLT